MWIDGDQAPNDQVNISTVQPSQEKEQETRISSNYQEHHDCPICLESSTPARFCELDYSSLN